MERRDISRMLLGAAAGSLLLSRAGPAQACASSYGVLTAAEASAGVTPTNTAYPPLDVRRYGAIMDGCAADDSALAAAILVAGELSGAEIFIPNGTLRITTAHTLPTGAGLVGAGRRAAFIKVDGAIAGINASTTSHAAGTSNFHTRVIGLGFLGTAGALGALNFSKINLVLVRDCSFEDFTATNAYGIQMTQCFLWNVEHCFFQNIAGVAVNLRADAGLGCNHGTFGPGNEVIGNNQSSFIGLNAVSLQNLMIIGNDFEGSTNGNKAIDIAGSEGVWICGNYIELWTQAAIAINSGASSGRVFIMENVIHASSTNVCNFNNVSNPNSNIVVALNRFPDLTSTQVCAFVGTTSNFCEFNNDPDIGKITENYSPSATTARALEASTTWNPPLVASGSATSTNVTVTGAAVGDPCLASFDKLSTNDLMIAAHVSAANTVRVVMFNRAASAIDLASGTLRVKVFK